MGIESLRSSSVNINKIQAKVKTEQVKDVASNVEIPKQISKEKFKALALSNDGESSLISKLREINPKKDFDSLFEKRGDVTLTAEQLSNLKKAINFANYN